MYAIGTFWLAGDPGNIPEVNFTLDFLPKLKSVAKFRDSYKNKEVVTLKDVEIPFIGFDELLQDKAANSRPKDLLDIKQLKSLKNKK